MQIVGVNCIPDGTVTTLVSGVIKKARIVFNQEKKIQDTPTTPFYKSLSMYYSSSWNKYFLSQTYGVIGAWEHWWYPAPIGLITTTDRIKCVENSTGTFYYDYHLRPIYTQSGDVITVEFSTLMNSMVFPDYQLITDVQVVIENGVKKFALTKETITFHKVS
jgi:hypothetical protein